MHINRNGLAVFALFCVLLMLALSSNASWVRIAEAIVSVLIVLNLGSLLLRPRNRTR